MLAETDNDFEYETSLEHDDWLTDGYKAGKFAKQSSGTSTFDVDGLWSGDTYKTYAVMEMLDGTLSNTAYEDTDYDTTTLDAPEDASCGIKLYEYPDVEDMPEIACALSLAIGFPCEQIKWDMDWIYDSGETWEIVFLLQADPSGSTTYDPEEVVYLFNSYDCEVCLSDFQSALEDDLGSAYSSYSLGLSSTNTIAWDDYASVVPTYSEDLYSTDNDEFTITYGGGREDDVVYCTLVEGDTTGLGDLSAWQVSAGLNHYNEPAEGFDWQYYNSDGTATIVIRNLAPERTYTIYTVSLNWYSTLNNGVYSAVSGDYTITTGTFYYEEEEEEEEYEEEEYEEEEYEEEYEEEEYEEIELEESGSQLAAAVLLLLAVLIQ